MRSRLLTVVGTVALTLGGLLVSAGPAAADPARCSGWSAPADTSEGGGFSFKNVTPIYRGPYNDCAAFFPGVSGHGIDIHCYYQNTFGTVFMYLRDTSTGVAGWSRLDDLNSSGGPVIHYCYS
ncbi:MAG: hypothetical protein ABI047_11300 [Jatrophihabitantaceae bacterium]